MLVFPYWRVPAFGEACRAQPWTPPAPESFAPYMASAYIAPSLQPPPPPLYINKSSEEECSGGSSPEPAPPERDSAVAVCGWRGCGVRCGGVPRLSAHVAHAHAHPRADGLYYCAWQDCCRTQRGFNARYKMLVHIRTHTNERPHKCFQCQKSFSRAENLKIHIRSHSGEKPYMCPYEGCGKAYSNSSDRFKHTRTHKVEKPYRCKMPGCDKRYTDPSSLRKHVKTNKHYPPKQTPSPACSDDTQSPHTSPLADRFTDNQSTPAVISSTSPVTHYILPEVPKNDRLPIAPYRPEPLYPIRQPMYEIPYLRYTPVHTYSVLQSRKRSSDSDTRTIEIDELPLNLKCAKRIDCRPMNELLRSDLPLDLSTKI